MSKKQNEATRAAVVTGGGQGIGLCVCEHFIKAGFDVVIAEVNPVIGRKAQNALGEKAMFIRTDAGSEPSVKAMIAKAVRRFGRIDCVINNAAIGDSRPVEKLSLVAWKKVLDVNLSAAFLTAKHAARYLRKTQGCIVNIASTRALMSEANTEAYSASKGGLVALTHALAVSLGQDIRVNCISPGWIDTRDYTRKPAFAPLTEADCRQHPAGRVGRPDDIASMVLYLCSPEAGFITGQNFIIDGGMTKKMIYV